MHPKGVAADLRLRAEPAPLTLHRSHRRPLGAHPVPLLGGVGGVALLLAIILLADGAIIAGLVVLMLAVPLLGLFVGGVMREPSAPAARSSLQLAHRLRSLTGLFAVSVRAESRAGIGLARVRSHQRQLRRELSAMMAPLGEAVHRGDQLQADALKRRTAELERQIESLEAEASRLSATAREEMARERATAQPTRTLASAPAEPGRR